LPSEETTKKWFIECTHQVSKCLNLSAWTNNEMEYCVWFGHTRIHFVWGNKKHGWSVIFLLRYPALLIAAVCA